MNGIDRHLDELKAIKNRELYLRKSEQHQKYSWLADSQLPDCVRGELSLQAKMRTDYGEQCRNAESYWKRNAEGWKPTQARGGGVSLRSAVSSSSCPFIPIDNESVDKWRNKGKKDSVSGILIDPNSSLPSSLYSDSFRIDENCSQQIRKDFHIRGNPITEFGSLLVKMKNSIR